MSDYYRDRCRHGGILSNTFINFWWNRQVITNQYGKPGRAASNWGEDTIKGYLFEELLKANRRGQNEYNEFTSHIITHLNILVTPECISDENDIDLFVTLRYVSPEEQGVYYTGTAGDPIPLAKGWLQTSLQKMDESHPKHRPYLPYRHYFKSDVQSVVADEVYAVDVEIWPANVVVEKGGKLILSYRGVILSAAGFSSIALRLIRKFLGHMQSSYNC